MAHPCRKPIVVAAGRAAFQNPDSQILDLKRLAGTFSALKYFARAGAGNCAPGSGAEFVELHAVAVEDANSSQPWKAEFLPTNVDDFLVDCVSFAGMEIQSVRTED